MSGRRVIPGIRRIGLAVMLGGAAAGTGALAAAQQGAARTERNATTLELSLENIHRAPGGVSDAAISPAGDQIAVVAEGADGRGIYLVPVPQVEPRAPRWWRPGNSPAWAPDGRSIVFVAGGDLWVSQIEQAGEPVRLTQGLAGVRDPVWAPGGRQVAFYSAESGHQDIWLVDATGDQPPRQLTRAAMALDDPRFQPAWSPNGERIAYISNAAGYWMDDVWVVQVESGRSRQISRNLMASSTPIWSPGGDRIALFGTAKDQYWYQDLAYLYTLDPEDPGSERPLAMQVYATDNAMSHCPFWSGDGATLYFPYMERGHYDLWAVPATGGVATRVSNLGGAMRSFHATPGADAFVLVRSGPTEGAEAYHLDARGGPAVLATSFSPRWRNLQAPQEVAYRAFDGLYIQGFLYLPRQVEAGRTCPALVQVHGGGTNSYLQGLNLTEQYLASQGFVVLAINYRGGSGFGREFQDLAVEDWLGNQALDAGAAADYLRSRAFVNGKVGIYGGSYGGSMSMAAITRAPDKFDAAVPMRGAYSKTETFEETDRLGKIFTLTGHGGLPDQRPDSYETSNTLMRLDRVRTPVLLMHGERDRRVPFRHYELAVAELKRLGKSFESHSYPEEGHGFRNPDNRIDMYQRLEDFFTRHLGSCAG